MNKVFQVLGVALLAFNLSACGSGGEGDSGGNNLPTYTEAQFTADTENLNSTEKSLEAVGLKFKKDFDYNNGYSTTTYSWDNNFLKAYANTQSAAGNGLDFIQPLRNYIQVATAYTAKYSNAFNMKRNDGSVSQMKLTDTVKEEIYAKVNIANKSIDKLGSL